MLENGFAAGIDWRSAFVPEVSLLELVMRGTIMYLALFGLMRFIFKREAGGLAMSDILVVVVIADAAQNALSADYRSIPEGVVLVLTVMGWSYALSWLGYHNELIGRMVHPPPLELVRDGRLLRRNMRQELITEDELMTHIREQGIADLSGVKTACMEADGRISVITASPPPNHPEQPRPGVGAG